MPRGTPLGYDDPSYAAPTPNPAGAEALISQILGLSSERERIAREDAEQAQSEYQQAERTPVAADNPLTNSLATAGSRIATTLAGPGGPDYSKANRANIEGRRVEKGNARTENIKRLRDTYEKAATRAAQMHDTDSELKARVALKKLDEQAAKEKSASDEIRWKAQQDYAAGIDDKQATTAHGRAKELEGIRSTNRTDLKQTPGALAEGAGGNDAVGVDNYANQVISGQIDFTAVPTRGGVRDAVSSRIAEMGEVILPKKVREAVTEVGAALKTVEELDRVSRRVNSEKPGVAVGKGIKSTAGQWFGSDLDAGTLDDIRSGLLGNLSRAVSAERGVLTEQDVQRVKKMMPNAFTPKDRAASQIKLLREFLKNKVETARKAYAIRGTEMGGGGTSSPTAAPSGTVSPAAPTTARWGRDAQGNPVRLQ